MLQQKDVKVYGDLYFNLAEAYFAVGETAKALVLYQALNHNTTVHILFHSSPLPSRQ